MPDLLIEQTGGVVNLTFNRPERLNALTTDLLNSTADTIEKLDDTVRVVVLRGAGRAFSSGADLDLSDASGTVDTSTIDASNRLIRALRGTPRPVVAAVNGPAAGVAAAIALAADFAVAGESAYFLLAFANIGLMPDGGATALVPAAVGYARAARMAMLAERVPAVQAEQWGLIAACVPDDVFESEVESLAGKLAAGPTHAYAATKRAFNATALAGLELALETEREEQTALFSTGDFTEGVRAFTTKGRPRFRGQ